MKTSNKKQNSNYYLYPILFMALLFPLILRYATPKTYLEKYAWFSDGANIDDFFLYYKSIALIVVAVVIVGIIVYDAVKNKLDIRKSTYYIPLGIYIVLAVISAICSTHSALSSRGMIEQYEGIWIMLSYGILFFYTIQKTKNTEHMMKIMKAFVIGAFIVGLIGVLQLCHISYLDLSIGKWLIFGDPSIEISTDMDRYVVTSTIFNPNYMGVYACLLLPVTVGSIWASKTKNMKILSAITTVLLVLCTFGARSKTGLVIIAFSFVLMIIVFRKKFKHLFKWAAIGLFVLVISFVGVDALQGHIYSNSLKEAFTITKSKPALSTLDTSDDNVRLTYNSNILYVQCELNTDGQLNCVFSDKDKNQLQMNVDNENQVIGINDERFSTITLSPVLTQDNALGFTLTIDGLPYNFLSKDDTHGYLYVNSANRATEATTSKGVGFNNYLTFASGRGYIWSRSIPMLKDNILIGCGPDNFAVEFPQNDYAGRAAAGFGNTYISKPHNLFLQIAIQTGVVSLLAFLCIYGMYLVSSIKLLWKAKFEDRTEVIAAFILIGTIAFMISGLINDSCISVTPLYWILLGVGICCNTFIKKNREQQVSEKSLEK